MIPDIKKILYTTDLSKYAVHAFGYAASMANRYDAKITILHVLEPISASANAQLASMMGPERWKELQERNENEARTAISGRLEQFCIEMSAEMTQCPFIVDSIVVENGEPVEKILQQAEKIHADIVIMGTHGQGILADVMLGSTARRVLRRCKRPVMVIRLPERE
ncbi:MAG: universal stress protein [Pseudomonadota bacterium]